MTSGFIHSFESMGLVDGPGIRTIVFLQGCALRCSYCHNPDTWTLSDGKKYTSDMLVKKILRFKPYFGETGGVTFSGGDPLMQPEFLLDCLKQCKHLNIHTTIDTSGIGFPEFYGKILENTDLVLLDIKHTNDIGFKNLTGHSIKDLYVFLNHIRKIKPKVWIRHVVVPDLTDSVQHMDSLCELIKTIPNVEKIELLPYHTIGVHKYDNLNIPYKLKNIPPMNKEKTTKLQNYVNEKLGMK